MSRKTKKPTECAECGMPPWFRCMTCSRMTEGKGFWLALSKRKSATQAKVCKECMIVIRSYETIKAMEAGEYDHIFDTEKK